MRSLCDQLAENLDLAFPQLVAGYRDGLYGGLRRLYPNEAEDLTQETLIRAHRALAGYDIEQIRNLRLSGWIWTIALNLGRNHARDRARRPLPVDWDDRIAQAPVEPPDTVAWQRRFDLLSPLQRRAVILRHVVGLSYSEIAEATGRPEGTVKAEVSRGLARLRAIIEGET